MFGTEVDFVTSEMLEEETFKCTQFDQINNDDSGFEGGRCGICMDVIIDRGVLDCCQHWFCFACIDNWSTITNLCPLCQGEFQLITCVPVYDTTGSNNIDEDSVSRDDDWSIDEKSNSLSFPSYYIDENAVMCLDGDGCKIRNGNMNIEAGSNLDTSIACDSCDLWYHAFCVDFDPEGTFEESWLCPRCVVEVPQNSAENSVPRTNNQLSPKSDNGECLTETANSRKLSVSVADVGETALVVSFVEESQSTVGPKEKLSLVADANKSLTCETYNLEKVDCTLNGIDEKPDMQSILEPQKLDLSLCHGTPSPSISLGLNELKIKHVDGRLNSQSSLDGIKISSTNESESTMGLHLGLSVGSFLSVDEMEKGASVEPVVRDFQESTPSEESLPKACKIEPVSYEDASQIIGVKRNRPDFSDDIHANADDEGSKGKKKKEASAKKLRADEKTQLPSFKDKSDVSTSDDSQESPTLIAQGKNGKSKLVPKRESAASDLMSIVRGTTRRPSKVPSHQKSADSSSTERENASVLRVKKIMRRGSEDKDSSAVVQELRNEIREAVRNRSTTDVGENLFDPKLLAAFRAAIAGPKPDSVKKLSPSAVKMKKSMLEKGKVRENLTKKIYGNSSGKRKHAWVRDCEVEFWKYRCMRAGKPEKIETLKSVLDLLRKNSDSSGIEQTTESRTTNPILSRLYLADTSVFPRKDDIKPLSALKPSANSEIKERAISPEKSSKLSIGNSVPKILERNKVPSLADEKATHNNVSCSKGVATSSKVQSHTQASRPSVSPSVVSTTISKKGTTVKSADVKTDKRKWALEILARKNAAGKSSTHEKPEDNKLKGNYPLLAKLPSDMRPVLAPSCHNKVPISVRQTQLYRLSECFLKKANLPVIRRTAETELAVADAVNIEKVVADRSSSKLVYLNLCSQEILRHSDNKQSVEATESNPSPSDNATEETIDKISTDPAIEEALREAGLLSDSPPSSPDRPSQIPNEADISSVEPRKEEPDNIFELDSHAEMDIYGDFEYDLEDEDYIGASAVKVPTQQTDEASKMKVVFSTLNAEKSTDNVDVGDSADANAKKGEMPKEAGIKVSTEEGQIGTPTVPPEPLAGEEAEDLSLAECEELYGPDKEPMFNELDVPDGKAPFENIATNTDARVSTGNCNSSTTEKSPTSSQTSKRIPRNDTPTHSDPDKHSDVVNSVSKKVEAYIKEHIRPLCKSGVITAEQYRWTVAKTTDKVMKYHSNAKNANFLIKEGEKVKKLAEQYIEAAQQKEKPNV